MYSPFPLALNATLAVPALGLCLLFRVSAAQLEPLSARVANGKEPVAGEKAELDPLPVRPFITAYRGSMLVITCLAILAVDFKVFPRRFAKVETWGTSLMDIGVGSFVFTAGLVAARPTLKSRSQQPTTTLFRGLTASVRHALPLLVLGFVRLYSVKGLDYAEHVTEYGVHWNFFFTLAFLPPFVALLDPVSATYPVGLAIISLIIGSLYQTVLELTGLKAYILTAPRVDLLSQNREGVFSFFGYLATFLAGKSLGLQILLRRPLSSPNTCGRDSQRKKLLLQLLTWSVFWSCAFFVATSYRYGFALQVSRRLANLPYVLWVSAFNCAQITLFCLVETLLFPKVYRAANGKSERREVERATSWVLKAYNRNGLAIFLVANLFTGLINLTLDTLMMGRTTSMSILLSYAAIVSSLAMILDSFDLSIKL